MKIIILGAGQVGGSLAETLIGENHDITLVDRDSVSLQYFADRLDIRTIAGSCSYPGVLRQAGADTADMLIAVTNNDEANIVACQVASALFKVPTKMARIRSRHYFVRKDLFSPENIPVDVLVSPELMVTRLVKDLLETPGAIRLMDIGEGVAKVVVLRPFYGGKLLGKTIAQAHALLEPVNFRIITIYRNNKPVALHSEFEIALGDRLYLITESEQVKTLLGAFRCEEEPLKKIMITGGGNIGGNLARLLQGKKSVKLVDHNRRRCEYLANELSDVTVLCGEANDSTLLVDEQVEKVDAFLALTSDDEANIISCIQAKQLGARQTFALINRNDYFNIIDPGAINVRISPALATMEAILKHIRQGDIKAVFPIRRAEAEIIEAVVHGDRRTSKLAERHVSQIHLPKTAQIVALIRDGRLILPHDDTRVESADRVVIFVGNKDYVGQVEKVLEVNTGFF